MTTPPSGFANRPKPRSALTASSFDSHDRVVSIAKAALQSYIQSFLDTTGQNRVLTKAVSGQALQFVTDRSLQDSPDPNLKPTQLARMYNDIRQKIPAIMIIDGGIDWEEPGLGGGLERVSMLNGKWQGWYTIFARINVVVAAVAMDPETCSTLQNVLSIFFKQLRVEAGGSLMSSKDPAHHWEVRLPINFSSTVNQPSNVSDDPKDAIWASSIELELQVEDVFVIEREVTRVVVDDPVVGSLDGHPSYTPTIDAPDSVQAGSGPFMLIVNWFDPTRHRLALSDGTRASLDLESMMITPHQPGSFSIMVLDTKQDQGTAPAPWAKKVIASHTVTVTF